MAININKLTFNTNNWKHICAKQENNKTNKKYN